MSFLYRITIFLGAFLLFTIQPFIGKQLLPWFGGSASVWTTLMLFFTTALFFGYFYAFIISRLDFYKQKLLYLITVCVTVISLIAAISARHNLINISLIGQFGTASPIFSVLLLVTMSIGLPYLLLATITTVLQSWYKKESGKSPYGLYAVSNIGSLAGLLTYPFFWEPFFTLKQQETGWIGLFLLFSVCLIAITVSLRKKNVRVLDVKKRKLLFPFSHIFPWLALSTLSTAMVLVTTSQITQNLPPMPLLWLMPLGLYLLSFVIAFSSTAWYNRMFYSILLFFLIIAASELATRALVASELVVIEILLINCFVTGLLCHGELYRIRPHANFLSLYYLVIAFGGVIASVFCSIVAPLFFSDLWETPIIFVCAGIMGTIFLYKTAKNWLQEVQYIAVGLVVIYTTGFMFFIFFTNYPVPSGNQLILTKRNFYAINRITETKENNQISRFFINNVTIHGSQSLEKESVFEPTLYFARDSGIGIVLEKHPKRLQNQPLRIGVVGLGVGTMAAYCTAGDYIRFYELNPDVVTINEKYFSYVDHCRQSGGEVDVGVGDGRLLLKQELDANGSQQFDVLVIDAFTDDVTPVHLLTQEAILLYIAHLSNQGIIALNLSNKYLDLVSALNATIAPMNLYSFTYAVGAKWFFISPYPILPFTKQDNQSQIFLRPWTDDYSNILPVMK